MKRALLGLWTCIASPATFASGLASSNTLLVLAFLLASSLVMAPFQVLAFVFTGVVPIQVFKAHLMVTLLSSPIQALLIVNAQTLLFWLTTLVLGARSGYRVALRGYAYTFGLGVLLCPFVLLFRLHVGVAAATLAVLFLVLMVIQWRVMNQVAHSVLGLSKRRSIVATSVPYCLSLVFFSFLLMTLHGKHHRRDAAGREPSATTRRR